MLDTLGQKGPREHVEGYNPSCSALRKEDGTYAPAHLLYDVRMERAGRNSVCEDSRSAPTGTACCLAHDSYLQWQVQSPLGPGASDWDRGCIGPCQRFLGEAVSAYAGLSENVVTASAPDPSRLSMSKQQLGISMIR